MKKLTPEEQRRLAEMLKQTGSLPHRIARILADKLSEMQKDKNKDKSER